MRMKVGVLTASMVASVLAFGAPATADDTSTTADSDTSTTIDDPSTTAGDTSTSTTDVTTSTVAGDEPATATTVEDDTATTVADTTVTAVAECPPDGSTETTTTVDESTTTTTIAGCPAPTTVAETTGTTGTTGTSTTDAGPAIDVAAAPAPTSPDVGPARAGAGPPVRGTQVQTRPIPPTTTTTTTTTLPSYGLPANSGSGRRVVYSKSLQRVWAVDSNGVVIKTHLVSGRQTPLDPRPGNYRVWSRSRYTHSINNPSITWGFMVRFAWGARGGNIGFHEIPFQYGRPVQSIWQLGQPLSGGCVRQARPDAIWMWNWAQLGTRVVVLG